MILEDKNIRLRAIEPEDLEHFYRWENDTSLWENSTSFAPYSKYMLKRYIEQTNNNIFEDSQLRLMIEKKDDAHTIVGCIDIFDFDAFNQRACWGILVDEKFRRKGYARSALSLVMEYCFNTLKIKQLYCKISAKNTPCLQLVKNTDFVQCATLKSWAKNADEYVDVLMFQLVK